MAILDDLPGLEVTITQNGEAINEHVDNEVMEDERTTTRYIEAKSEKNFEICLKVAKGTKIEGDCLSCAIYIDGNWIVGSLLRKEKFATNDYVDVRASIVAGPGLRRNFRFAGLETASDGNIFKGEAAKVKDLGTITVEVTHVDIIAKTSSNKNKSRTPFETMGIISEKAVKGRTLSHSVGFDEVKSSSKENTRNCYSTKLVKGTPSPAATFVFHYRSYEALKSMLIIPRTPSPPPPPSLEEKAWEDMTPEEQATVLREFRATRKANVETAVKIKREREDNNPRPRKVARPKAGDTQLEIGEDGSFREGSTATLPEPEIIEID